jgi:hypothetical protein
MYAARSHPAGATNRPSRVTVQLVDSSVCASGGRFFMKGPDERDLEQKEETMRLISSHELQQRSESELSALFRTVSEGLVRTRRGSPERRNALASLENISRMRAERMSTCQP